MSDRHKLIRDYYRAFSDHRYDDMIPYLHEDFHFEDPFDTIDGARKYVEALSVLKVFDHRIDVRHSAVNGDMLAIRFDWTVNAPVEKTVAMSEWFTFDGDKIRESRLFFDSRDFADLLQYMPGYEEA